MNSKRTWRWAVLAVAVLAVVGVGAAQEKPASVAGKWELTWEGPRGPQTSTLTLEQNGADLKGTMSGRRGDTPVTGKVKGKEVTIVVERETPQGKFTQEFKGTVDGAAMKGTLVMRDTTIEWAAKKL